MSSSLIEQAAQRLEQLRRAGANVPAVTRTATTPSDVAPPSGGAALPPAPTVEPAPSTELATVNGFAPVDLDRAPVSRQVELDLDALSAAGIVTPNAPRSHVADQYRVIKRPLISNAMGKSRSKLSHGNLIMVTSALVGEGKSFTSINLAMSIAAEVNTRVMLVDADVARPSVLRVLGLPPSPGLLDLLEGKAEMTEVLMRTNIDKLTIMPSGTPHRRSTELLASEAMGKLLDDMAKRYPDRIIIFDSPPLLLTTESRVLASHMGQIVMVVQAEKTLRADVQYALSTIETCPVKMMVLNMARADANGSDGLGYGYGYGYGQAYGTDVTAVSSSPTVVS